MKPIITLVAAVSKNNVIGKSNDLPWYLPEDLKRFKELTTGKTVLMGRKTFDSIVKRLGKPLPNRKSVVLTRQHDVEYPEGVVVIHHLQPFLDNSEDEEIMVIGGGQLFEQMFPHANKLHITHIDDHVEGDVNFPEIDPKKWQKIREEMRKGFRFTDYEKIK